MVQLTGESRMGGEGHTMTDVYKQGIDADVVKKLETALEDFLEANPPGNPGISQQIERVEGDIRISLNSAGDSGTAVMGAASALLAYIRASRDNRLPFRKPYPKD
jgi:hypothetical protein